MKRERLVLELAEAQSEYSNLYDQGCRAATVMGVLKSKVNIANAKIALVDAQYQMNINN